MSEITHFSHMLELVAEKPATAPSIFGARPSHLRFQQSSSR